MRGGILGIDALSPSVSDALDHSGEDSGEVPLDIRATSLIGERLPHVERF
jgi:hypothetical protein